MHAIKSGLLWLLCAIDVALGLWLAQVFVAATREAGVARTVTAENAGYVLYTALLFIAPALCWQLRKGSPYYLRLMLAVLPIALFLMLGGKLWVRWT